MKKIGGCVYVHWTAHRQLDEEQKNLLYKAISICRVGFDKSEVYKIDVKNQKVSFIESDDFDKVREPMIHKSWCVDIKTKEVKEIKGKGQIYHHKWMFVSDDYNGFDIEESKRWSEKWQSVLPKEVKSRIGYKKYWDEYLKQYNLEVE